MGCDYNFTCKTCKKNYYLGYGSYGTWAIVNDLDEYEDQPEQVKKLQKNENLKLCIKNHPGHDFVLWSNDWANQDENGNLVIDVGYETAVLAENYSGYEQFKMV